MKIFISHSSRNKFYGEKLVDLLKSVGVVYFGLIVPLFSVKPCHYNS